MARDLNKFFAQHRKSHTRYISSVDSLIEKYEDVSDDELESVVNLSSCTIVKDKKGIFDKSTWFASKTQNKTEGKLKNTYKTSSNRELRLSFTSLDSDVDSEKLELDYEVLKDVSTSVASFLEEGESEPSDGETISSTSTTSYETIISEEEEESTQDSRSREDDIITYQDKAIKENIYDEIDGGSVYDNREIFIIDSQDSNDAPQHERQTHQHYNTDGCKRIDGRFIDDEHTQQKAVKRVEPVPFNARHDRNYAPEQGAYRNRGQYSDIGRPQSSSNIHRIEIERDKGKRISTVFTPLNNIGNKAKGHIDHGSSNLKSPHSRSMEKAVFSHNTDSDTENTFYSPGKIEYENNKAKQMNEGKGSKENEVKLTHNDQRYLDDKISLQSPVQKPHSDWLSLRFNPTNSPGQNDLSPSHRKRPSIKFTEDKSAIKYPTSYDKKESQVDKIGAKKTIPSMNHILCGNIESSNPKRSSFRNDEITVPISSEIEYESMLESNRSSKKDSGFSTLHDESLTIDTTLHEHPPEALTLENVDSFNRSLADKSSFINVSVNCSEMHCDEQAEKVEKWLVNVSAEMEKEFETTIDREINEMSEEVFRDGIVNPSVNRDSVNHGAQMVRYRHNSAEVIRSPCKQQRPFVSRSCLPLNKIHSGRITSGNTPHFVSPNVQKSRNDRLMVRGHRSGQNLHQRVRKQNIADLMKMFTEKNDGNSPGGMVRTRHSDYSGKRFIDSPNDKAIQKVSEDMPTPPKSRKLSGSVKGKQTVKDTYIDGKLDLLKSPEHVKARRSIENQLDYLETDLRHMNKPRDSHEVIAYMVPRSASRHSMPCRTETADLRRVQSCQDNRRIDDHVSQERMCNAHYESPPLRFERELQQSPRKVRSSQGLESRTPVQDQRDILSPKYHISDMYEVSQSYVRKLAKSPGNVENRNDHRNNYCDQVDRGSVDNVDRYRNMNNNNDYMNSPVQENSIRPNQLYAYSDNHGHTPTHKPYHDIERRAYDEQRYLKSSGSDKKTRDRRKSNENGEFRIYEEGRRNTNARSSNEGRSRSKRRSRESLEDAIDHMYQAGVISPRAEIEWLHKQCHLGSPFQQQRRHPAKTPSPTQQGHDNGIVRKDRTSPGQYNDPIIRENRSPRGQNNDLVFRGNRTPRGQSNDPIIRENRTSRGPTNDPVFRKNRTPRGQSNDPIIRENRTPRGQNNDPVFRENRTPRGQSNDPIIRENRTPRGQNNDPVFRENRTPRGQSNDPIIRENRTPRGQNNDPVFRENRTLGGQSNDPIIREVRTHQGLGNDPVFRENRTPLGQRNNRSPRVQRVDSSRDSGFLSPSARKDTEVKYQDFSSPVFDRARHVNDQDAFSPSSPFARMRLNKPKSSSIDRHRQHRNAERSGKMPYSVNDEQREVLYGKNRQQLENQYRQCVPERQMETHFVGIDNMHLENPFLQNKIEKEDWFRESDRQVANQLKENEIRDNTGGNLRQAEVEYQRIERDFENQYRGIDNQTYPVDRTGRYSCNSVSPRNIRNQPLDFSTGSRIKTPEKRVRKSPKQFRHMQNQMDLEKSVPQASSVIEQEDGLSPRFVSLDQIKGMPLQLRIQQLESGTFDREKTRAKQWNGRSNAYICDNSDRDSFSRDLEETVKNIDDGRRDSNVYHRYCNEVGVDNGRNSQRTSCEKSVDDNSNRNSVERNTPKSSNEPKMRKNLFSPNNSVFKPLVSPQTLAAGLQEDLDLFKTPTSPAVFNRTKLNKHDKENVHDKVSVSPQTFRSGFPKPLGKVNKLPRNSVPAKMTPAQFMQSTPIKPGVNFTLNTTMSTILGSDDTEINSEPNEEIVLI